MRGDQSLLQFLHMKRTRKQPFQKELLAFQQLKVKQTQRVKVQEGSLCILPGFLHLLDTTGSKDSREGSELAELARSDEEGPTTLLEESVQIPQVTTPSTPLREPRGGYLLKDRNDVLERAGKAEKKWIFFSLDNTQVTSEMTTTLVAVFKANKYFSYIRFPSGKKKLCFIYEMTRKSDRA